ncbi:hypothetical protein ACFQER_12740 [Halomicroarcula sp. GCM10025894]|uniref:hypothetical protein n=1 Tax=Halomicroarcula sp. GCM10025894 TaxID=3252673 RepID=UPI00361C46C7
MAHGDRVPEPRGRRLLGTARLGGDRLGQTHRDTETRHNARRRPAPARRPRLRRPPRVSTVEVSTDGGSSWSEATLSDPLPAADGDGPAADAWRQWQYSYDPPGSTHTVVVRMVDRDGNVQTSEETDPAPTGPSGWVSKEFES